MTDKTYEIVRTYEKLDRVIYYCLPEDDAAIKAECGAWDVEIVPKYNKKHTFRRAFDRAFYGQELQRILDKLQELDDMRAFNESYYNRGWWSVSIRHKDKPDRSTACPEQVAEFYARLYGMNDKWCNLTVHSENARLTIEGAEKGERTKTLIVNNPRGEIWDEAEALVARGADYQGTVIGDLNRKVKYDLREIKTWLKQPSVTVRDKNKVTDYEGRAVQVTELPAMTVITLWKGIEYK
jgi:hypothetical protein